MTDAIYKRLSILSAIYGFTGVFASSFLDLVLWLLPIRFLLVGLGILSLTPVSAECAGGKCTTKFFAPNEASYNTYIFISFSVPERIWIELNEDLKKVRGAFVLNGLPSNSMKEFASRVAHLRKRGVTAPIMLDAKKFKFFNIKAVPATVIHTEKEYRMFSGAVRPSELMQMSNAPVEVREVKP